MKSRRWDVSRRVIDFIGIAVAGLLLFRFYAIYGTVGLRLNHDEAEHLHVAFALERGERPYLDFIENHPMLFHLGILALKWAFSQDTVLGLYMLVRLWVLLAFAGCIYFVYRLCEDYCRHEGSQFRTVSVFLLVFLVLGILPESNDYLWDVRPDWFCYLLSLACIYAHYRAHTSPEGNWTAGNYLSLGFGGMAGGLATAVLAKSLYIFAPYALVASLIFAQQTRLRRIDLRRLFAGNVLFVGVGAFVFCLAVFGEIYMTGATIDAYYKANFVINRIVHPVATLTVTPVSQFVALAGGEFRAILVGTLATVLLLVSLRKRLAFEFYTLLFLFLLVGFNIRLLASTNNAYWMHNFAPSLLGFLGIGFVLVHRILVYFASVTEGSEAHCFPRPPSALSASLIEYAVMLCLSIWMSFSFVARMDEAIASFHNLRLSRFVREFEFKGHPAELPADRLLPSNLAYLVFDPSSMPLRARHWGYYFMLGPDGGFWQDNHALGIGPDPVTYWKNLYATEPPDAILFSGNLGSFSETQKSLLRNQRVDISWLVEHLDRDYMCVYRSTVAVHIRIDQIAQLGGSQWKRCNE